MVTHIWFVYICLHWHCLYLHAPTQTRSKSIQTRSMPPNAYTNMVCLHMLIHTWTMYKYDKYVPTHSLCLLAPTKALSIHANKNIVNTCPHKHKILSTLAYRNMVYAYICLHKQGLYLFTYTNIVFAYTCLHKPGLSYTNESSNKCFKASRCA